MATSRETIEPEPDDDGAPGKLLVFAVSAAPKCEATTGGRPLPSHSANSTPATPTAG